MEKVITYGCIDPDHPNPHGRRLCLTGNRGKGEGIDFLDMCGAGRDSRRLSINCGPGEALVR
jgi:hypothetical protein